MPLLFSAMSFVFQINLFSSSDALYKKKKQKNKNKTKKSETINYWITFDDSPVSVTNTAE